MVVEISPGRFQCERVGCERTFAVEDPRGAIAEVQEAANKHEGRDSEHVRVVNLSALKPRPGTPDTWRGGFVTVVLQKTGTELLSTRILPERDAAELEASLYTRSFYTNDLIREETADRLKAIVANTG